MISDYYLKCDSKAIGNSCKNYGKSFSESLGNDALIMSKPFSAVADEYPLLIPSE